MAAARDMTGFPINSVTLVIAYEVGDGKIEEVVHQVDGKKVDILKAEHGIERKVRPVKDEDGSIKHYERTGEEILKLQVKYIRGE